MSELENMQADSLNKISTSPGESKLDLTSALTPCDCESEGQKPQ